MFFYKHILGVAGAELCSEVELNTKNELSNLWSIVNLQIEIFGFLSLGFEYLLLQLYVSIFQKYCIITLLM